MQEWLDHESLATTQKYLEPSKETERQLEAMKLPFLEKCMSEAPEARKEAIAKRLTDLAVEESRLLTNRPLNAPVMTWTQYERRTKEIDEERNKLRQELW